MENVTEEVPHNSIYLVKEDSSERSESSHLKTIQTILSQQTVDIFQGESTILVHIELDEHFINELSQFFSLNLSILILV